jgi:putative transposase
MLLFTCMRSAQLITGAFYHVYSRGVDRRSVFLRYGHFSRFLSTVRLILKTGSATERSIKNQSQALKPGVEILAYCLMPNHYHFLMKQVEDNGISTFMHKLDTSYSKYFNMNSNRTGHLFEYAFKAKSIDSDEELLHVSRYIHLNPVVAHLVDEPEQWKWSSCREYVDIETKGFCQTEEILASFSTIESYKAFIHDQMAYAMLLKEAQEYKNAEPDFF